MSWTRESLIAAARDAATRAYAPYSNFHVGAALGFADGSVVTGANVENASYGLTLCAETVAVGKALSEDWRGRLEAVAVIGGKAGAVGAGDPVTPCGRCRQVLNEVAALGDNDPTVWCVGENDVLELVLSDLLPRSFGPSSLS
ncbi:MULTISPECIES: cytidine deaminase [unclassified Novosphingobium]|uniref:cytidine deaminase n=1 Tax=unclassified Novosphingobium TaxID=2644732 RepID=UPI000EDE96D4|nr:MULTISPECIES: cytidine deaminase [unclassified Novosphingobium]HCF24453.1 cytidine deaminase [Novosphingobium sp.]HQV02104.1 cytidine deaminase [Novosphingobium sp.]